MTDKIKNIIIEDEGDIAESEVQYNNLDARLQSSIDIANYLVNNNEVNRLFKEKYFGYGTNGIQTAVTDRIGMKPDYLINIEGLKNIIINNQNNTYDIAVVLHAEKITTKQVYDSGWISNSLTINVLNYSTAKYMAIRFRNKNNSSNILPSEVENIDNIKLYLVSNIDESTININKLLDIVNDNITNRLDKAISGYLNGGVIEVEAVSAMTNINKIYANLTNNKWYFYNQNSWTIGGDYQRGQTITEKILDTLNEPADSLLTGMLFRKDYVFFNKKFDYNSFCYGDISSINGDIIHNSSKISRVISKYLLFFPDDISITGQIGYRFGYHLYNSDNSYVANSWSGWKVAETITIPKNQKFSFIVTRQYENPSEELNIQTAIEAITVKSNYINTFEEYLNTIEQNTTIENTISFTCRQGEVDNYPENTLEGFRRAKELGYNHIRLSFGWTSDDIPVCMHDNQLSVSKLRNSNGTSISDTTLYAANLTYSQIQQYDAGIYKGSQFAGIKVPTVEQVLIQAKKLQQKVDIEFKFGYTEERLRLLLKMIYKYGMQDACLYSSDTSSHINYINNSIYKIDTGLIANLSDGAAQNAVTLGCKRLDIFDFDTYREDSIIIAHRGGVKIKYGSAYDLNTVNNVIDKYDVIEVANIANPILTIINNTL